MKTKSKQSGFTINQLLVTMGIVAILAAIAYPFYQNFVKQGRMNDAKKALLINAQNLEKHYQQNHSFKQNSTTWVNLPHTQTDFFCIKMQGNPRGTENNKFTIKAVPFNKSDETRILTINQDHTLMMCESSDSSCGEKQAFFTNAGRADKNCTIVN